MFPVRIATATTIRPCSAGYYCTRGTPAYLATRNRCPVGYYCPVGTASDKAKDIRCPRKTTSSTGASELLQCNIEPSSKLSHSCSAAVTINGPLATHYDLQLALERAQSQCCSALAANQ
eukprot:10241-Heterococcus_DN1.PRE.1